jgi:hypothetical protein
VLMTANTAGTNGLPKHEGPRDNTFLDGHPSDDRSMLLSFRNLPQCENQTTGINIIYKKHPNPIQTDIFMHTN